MRNWILKKLNAISRDEYTRLYLKYLDDMSLFNRTIEIYEMHSAFRQAKKEQVRVH